MCRSHHARNARSAGTTAVCASISCVAYVHPNSLSTPRARWVGARINASVFCLHLRWLVGMGQKFQKVVLTADMCRPLRVRGPRRPPRVGEHHGRVQEGRPTRRGKVRVCKGQRLHADMGLIPRCMRPLRVGDAAWTLPAGTSARQ